MLLGFRADCRLGFGRRLASLTTSLATLVALSFPQAPQQPSPHDGSRLTEARAQYDKLQLIRRGISSYRAFEDWTAIQKGFSESRYLRTVENVELLLSAAGGVAKPFTESKGLDEIPPSWHTVSNEQFNRRQRLGAILAEAKKAGIPVTTIGVKPESQQQMLARIDAEIYMRSKILEERLGLSSSYFKPESLSITELFLRKKTEDLVRQDTETLSQPNTSLPKNWQFTPDILSPQAKANWVKHQQSTANRLRPSAETVSTASIQDGGGAKVTKMTTDGDTQQNPSSTAAPAIPGLTALDRAVLERDRADRAHASAFAGLQPGYGHPELLSPEAYQGFLTNQEKMRQEMEARRAGATGATNSSAADSKPSEDCPGCGGVRFRRNQGYEVVDDLDKQADEMRKNARPARKKQQ